LGKRLTLGEADRPTVKYNGTVLTTAAGLWRFARMSAASDILIFMKLDMSLGKYPLPCDSFLLGFQEQEKWVFPQYLVFRSFVDKHPPVLYELRTKRSKKIYIYIFFFFGSTAQFWALAASMKFSVSFR
jgi:hypothetical protein